LTGSFRIQAHFCSETLAFHNNGTLESLTQ